MPTGATHQLPPMDALEYHQRTKHSLYSIQTDPHYLDWENQPLPFKVYSTLEGIPLPRELNRGASASGALDVQDLARLLYYTAGITKTKVFPNGAEHHFRAAACTGALYHIDIYVACTNLPSLEAGLYHFGPHDFALRRLRRGDWRGVIAAATGAEPSIADAPITLLFTSTFWRNSWKYQSRAYRHCYWDSGTMLANLLGVAAADDIAARLVVGFADNPINELLDVDTEKEVSLACVALGRGHQTPDTTSPAPPITPLGLETTPLSGEELDYSAIRAAHAGSSLASAEAARLWRESSFRRHLPPVIGSLHRLGEEPSERLPIEKTIVRRGSARSFVRKLISQSTVSAIARAAFTDIDADFRSAEGDQPTASPTLNDLYLICNAVDGLASGTYVYRPDEDALELLRSGDCRGDAGHLDLGQSLAADASLNCYLMSDLDQVCDRMGSRGYRAAAIEAAIMGGRIYLAAYSCGLAATGLTFFDDDVTHFFSPHAAGKGVMFLTAVGKSGKNTPSVG